MSASRRNDPLHIKIALCAVSMLGMGSLAASAGLAYIADEFPNVSTMWIQLLVTGPVLLQIPAALSASWLSRKISPKTLLAWGVVLFLVCGLLPFFIHVFPVILLLRILYGLAIGISTTLAGSLGFYYFRDEQERSRVFGLTSAFNLLGGMYYTFVGGQLSELGWQYCFLAYLIGVPILIILLVCLPDPGKSAAADGAKAVRIKGEVYWIAILSLVYMLLYFAYTNNISMFVINSGMGGSSQSGLSYSIVNGAGFLGGLVFSMLHRRMRSGIMPFAYLVTTAGFFVIGMSHTLPVLFVGSVLIGVSIAWVLPQANLLYGEIMPPEAMTFTVGVTGAIANFGQLGSTFVLVSMADFFSVQDERGVLMMSAWCYLALTAVVAVYILIRSRLRHRAG